MKPIFLTLIWLLLTVQISACTMDDSERCSDKYVWSEKQAACITPVDTDFVDTSPIQDGLGDPCSKDDDCKTGKYNKCLLDPRDATIEGMCTFNNCTLNDCGGDFECCDCKGVDFLKWEAPYCIPAESAKMLHSLCTCK